MATAMQVVHSLPVACQQYLGRVGAASFLETVDMYELVVLQLAGALSRTEHKQHIYQLGFRTRYIGRGLLKPASTNLPGGTGRFREHVQLWIAPAGGKRRRHDAGLTRYRLLRQGNTFSVH
eukprot:3111086-Pyramimonas_sp.AAC.1